MVRIRLGALLEARGLVSGVLAAGLTLVGPQLYPFPTDNAILRFVPQSDPTSLPPSPTHTSRCGPAAPSCCSA